MKKYFLFLLALLFILSGCVVFSLEPFFTKSNKIMTPENIIGEWIPVTLEGNDVSGQDINLWKFRNDKVISYDKKNIAGEINITFFKVNDQLFCDTQAESPDNEKLNQYWLYHLYPFHSLCKVSYQNDTLTFLPLNYEWIKGNVKEGKIKVPFVEWKSEDTILFTATSEQWESFIKEYSDDQEAFSEEFTFVFRKK
ncbi:MAG: hypothetical protein KAT74_00430 [Candidatus Cloacimonetes bacterium]|nr:hypothetical protein [Candidatus Cloacimonadota bacterium]